MKNGVVALSLSKCLIIEFMKLYFVYILECSDKSYYVGMTSNLSARIDQHNSGKYHEAYTFHRRPVELKWVE